MRRSIPKMIKEGRVVKVFLFYLACYFLLSFSFILTVNEFVYQISIDNLERRLVVSILLASITVAVITLIIGGSPLIFRKSLYEFHKEIFSPPYTLSFHHLLIINFLIICIFWTFFFLTSKYVSQIISLRGSATIVTVFGLLLTFIGLVLASRSLRQYRRIISSFDDFAHRLHELVVETYSEGAEPRDYLRILCYTPIPGGLALSERVYDKLLDSMMKETARLEIVCLDSQDISNWLQKYAGKSLRGGIVDATKIKNAIEDAERVIERLDDPDPKAKGKFAKEHQIVRLKAKEMPSFYLFFTNTRGLIVNPLFLPTPIVGADLIATSSTNFPVEIVGFETSDVHTLHTISDYYEAIRRTAQDRAPQAAKSAEQ